MTEKKYGMADFIALIKATKAAVAPAAFKFNGGMAPPIKGFSVKTTDGNEMIVIPSGVHRVPAGWLKANSIPDEVPKGTTVEQWLAQVQSQRIKGTGQHRERGRRMSSKLTEREYETVIAAINRQPHDRTVFHKAVHKVNMGSAIRPEGTDYPDFPSTLTQWRQDRFWSIEHLKRHQAACDAAHLAYWATITGQAHKPSAPDLSPEFIDELQKARDYFANAIWTPEQLENFRKLQIEPAEFNRIITKDAAP